MARTTCVKCGQTNFELKELNVSDSNFKLYSVQCSHCGVTIGLCDYYNVSYMVKRQQEAIKKIARHLGVSVDL